MAATIGFPLFVASDVVPVRTVGLTVDSLALLSCGARLTRTVLRVELSCDRVRTVARVFSCGARLTRTVLRVELSCDRVRTVARVSSCGARLTRTVLRVTLLRDSVRTVGRIVDCGARFTRTVLRTELDLCEPVLIERDTERAGCERDTERTGCDRVIDRVVARELVRTTLERALPLDLFDFCAEAGAAVPSMTTAANAVTKVREFILNMVTLLTAAPSAA